MSSAREIGGKTPTDMMLFLLKDDSLIAFSEQRDSKGVSMIQLLWMVLLQNMQKMSWGALDNVSFKWQ